MTSVCTSRPGCPCAFCTSGARGDEGEPSSASLRFDRRRDAADRRVHAKVREGAWGEIGARHGTDVVGRMQGEIASSVTSGNGDGGKILTVARDQ